MITGPELRAHRVACGKTLRWMAAKLGYSHGHLSKIESGERPPENVTVGYEAVLGQIRRHGTGSGKMTHHGRRHFSAQVAAVAVGGQLPGSMAATASSKIRMVARRQPATHPKASEVLYAAQLLHEEGGSGSAMVAWAAIQWAASLDLEDSTTREAVGVLALAAARAAIAAEVFYEARDLLVIAVWGVHHKPDLRSRALRTIAEVLLDSGYTNDASDVIHLAARGIGDEERKEIDALFERISGTETVSRDRSAVGEQTGTGEGAEPGLWVPPLAVDA